MFKTTFFIAFIATMFMLAERAGATTINVPADQPTIQAGIGAAMTGDEVVVAPGDYFESIDYFGKTITVRSESGDPTDTIIHADPGNRCVFINGSGDGTRLEGFTLTGSNLGPSAHGAGLHIFSGTGIAVTNCVFSGNSADGGVGGGATDWSDGATFSDCIFTGNSAQISGGVDVNNSGHTSFVRCTFSDNVALFDGGGVRVFGAASSVHTFLDCTFSGNSVSMGIGWGGGGLQIRACTTWITDCTFSDNSAVTNGGGVLLRDAGVAVVTGCTFSANSAGQGGGGLHARGSTASITDSTFSDNSAVTNGGGVHLIEGGVAVFTGCIFSANSAGQGGGIYNHNDESTLVLIGTGFCDNTPDAIAGAYHDGGETDLENCPPAEPEPTSCPADLDGDNTVGPADLAQLLGSWGSCE